MIVMYLFLLPPHLPDEVNERVMHEKQRIVTARVSLQHIATHKIMQIVMRILQKTVVEFVLYAFLQYFYKLLKHTY